MHAASGFDIYLTFYIQLDMVHRASTSKTYTGTESKVLLASDY